MIDRRSFLIGAGSILTVPFIDKAEWFLRNRNAVVPLIEPTEQTTELFFVRLGDQYELSWIVRIMVLKVSLIEKC